MHMDSNRPWSNYTTKLPKFSKATSRLIASKFSARVNFTYLPKIMTCQYGTFRQRTPYLRPYLHICIHEFT